MNELWSPVLGNDEFQPKTCLEWWVETILNVTFSNRMTKWADFHQCIFQTRLSSCNLVFGLISPGFEISGVGGAAVTPFVHRAPSIVKKTDSLTTAVQSNTLYKNHKYLCSDSLCIWTVPLKYTINDRRVRRTPVRCCAFPFGVKKYSCTAHRILRRLRGRVQIRYDTP